MKESQMKVFTIIVRILLIIGGLAILIIYPIMIENIDNDSLYQTLLVISKISVVTAAIGVCGNLFRALLLLHQEEVKNEIEKTNSKANSNLTRSVIE